MSALLRLLGWLMALALVALPVVAVLNGWIGSDRWPLTRLRATGEFQRVDAEQLRQAMLPYARQGFFAVRLDQAQAAAAQLPWVEHADVRKRWPDVLEVRVIEHKPFARWGKDQLLSEHGRLFRAEGVPAQQQLPMLYGPGSQVGEVVELYNQSQVLLAPIGLKVRAVTLDARGSWTLLVRNTRSGAMSRLVVGRDQANARLARFSRLAPQLLAQQAQTLVQADLRYTNGFALSWEPTPEDESAQDAGAKNTQGTT